MDFKCVQQFTPLLTSLVPTFSPHTASAASWFYFDGTRQGLFLAALCAIGAPASELLLLHMIPLWTYPKVG
jgi:hypothetical protein